MVVSVLLLVSILFNFIQFTGKQQYYSDEKGKMSFLFVSNEVDHKGPEFYSSYPNDIWKLFSKGLIVNRGEDVGENKIIKDFKIKRVPYFVFFDTKGVIYRTGDPNKVKKFLDDKYKKYSKTLNERK